MRARRFACLAVLLLAGCTHHIQEIGSAGIPYACADGKPARIFYAGGGYFPPRPEGRFASRHKITAARRPPLCSGRCRCARRCRRGPPAVG